MRRYTMIVNGQTYVLDIQDLEADRFQVGWGDQRFDVQLLDETDLASVLVRPLASPATTPEAAAAPKAVRESSQTSDPGDPALLAAPMPGVVLKIDAKAGDHVRRGQALLSLEAMKMVNPICARRDAQVVEVLVTEGQMVAYGDPLIRFGI